MAEENGVRFCDACGISLPNGQGRQVGRVLLCENCHAPATPSAGLGSGPVRGAANWARGQGLVFRLMAIAAFVLMLVLILYPPWIYTVQQQGLSQTVQPAPRAFLFAPPDTPAGHARSVWGCRLDSGRLLLECAVVALAAVIALLAFSTLRSQAVHTMFRRSAVWLCAHWLLASAVGAALAVAMIVLLSVWPAHQKVVVEARQADASRESEALAAEVAKTEATRLQQWKQAQLKLLKCEFSYPVDPKYEATPGSIPNISGIEGAVYNGTESTLIQVTLKVRWLETGGKVTSYRIDWPLWRTSLGSESVPIKPHTSGKFFIPRVLIEQLRNPLQPMTAEEMLRLLAQDPLLVDAEFDPPGP